jgi:hypothetical protein
MKYDLRGPLLMQESHFDEIRPFLTGETIDSNLSCPITHVDVKTPTDRVTFLGSLLEDKTVLHIGCADHLDVIDAKIAAGKHLHSALIKRSKNVTGIDLNVEAIEHLQGKYDIPDLHICNILEVDGETENFSEGRHYDFVLLAEVVEHLDNPGQFLTHLNDTLGHLYDRIIITVPNAFSSVARRAWKNGIENINSDHRFWFSPYTIARLTTAAGFKVEKVHMIGEEQRMDILSRAYNKLMAIIGSQNRRRMPSRHGVSVVLIATPQN